MSGGALIAQFADMTWPQILVAVVCVMLAIYSLIQLWTMANRESLDRRMGSIKRATSHGKPSQQNRLDTEIAASPPWYQRLGAFISATMLVGPADRARLKRALIDAGFAGTGAHLATLVAMKLGLLLVGILGSWTVLSVMGGFWSSLAIRAVVLLVAILLGWRLPDTVLNRLSALRRRRIERGLPDALDLLVISAEAGLSLEQGIDLVAREIRPAFPDIADEFSITSAELQVLGDRGEALHNLAERVNVPSIRSIVTTLVQTMRYGTPLAQSLRLLAGEMRSTRLLKMEERAARMPVLLTLPLAGFILPSLLAVVAGPALIRVFDALRLMMK